jgi:tetratricopeptide (TPR) repeat protein
MSERSKREDGGVVGREAGEPVEDLFRKIDEAAALLGEVLARPSAERMDLAQAVRVQGLELCQLLEARSEEAWCEDAVAGVELARIAVEIAGRLDIERYGQSQVEDAQATAWAFLGNAYRVVSDLRRAEEALDQAEAHLERSGGEAYTEAQILSFRASLRSSQGRYEEAVHLLDRALTIYRQAKDHQLEGKGLIKKAAALAYDGKVRSAARLARRGLALIDPSADPRLFITARHNLIGYLHETGSPEEALDTLRRTRRLYEDFGEPSHRARLSWLEGRITRDLGRLEEAEAALKVARDFFVQQGIGLDAARVLLDLAMVYDRRGETAELKRLSAEMVPIFASRDVDSEALAALALFQKAAATEQIDRALLDQIAVELSRSCRRIR